MVVDIGPRPAVSGAPHYFPQEEHMESTRHPPASDGVILPSVEALDDLSDGSIVGLALRLAALQTRLTARLAGIRGMEPEAQSLASSDGFLSLDEVARRTGLAEQTIRNLVSGGVFRRGVHYHKPRRKLLFDWAELRRWITTSGVGGGGGSTVDSAGAMRVEKARRGTSGA